MIGLKELLIKLLTGKVNKTGDTMTGNLNISRSGSTGNANIQLTSDTMKMDVRVNGSGAGTSQYMGLLDQTTGHWILYHNPSTLRTYHQYLCATSSSGTFASNVSGASSKTCNLYKIGKTVFIQFMIFYSTAGAYVPQNATICTIPETFRPSSRVSLPCYAYRNGAAVPGTASLLTINADGTISQNVSSVAQSIYCVGMYVQS